MKNRLGVFLIFFFLAGEAIGQAGSGQKLLSFKAWKQQQILDAENQVVRLQNRLHISRSSAFRFDSKRTLPSDNPVPVTPRPQLDARMEFKRPTGGNSSRTEEELQIAIENLQFTKNLTIDEYLAVYLRRQNLDAKAMKELASTLSSEEIVELLSIAMKYGQERAEERPFTTAVQGETSLLGVGGRSFPRSL